MNIAIIGSGYVGLVSGVCLAEIGHRVICVDNDKEKIRSLQKGQITIYEPGLEELMLKLMRSPGFSVTASAVPPPDREHTAARVNSASPRSHAVEGKAPASSVKSLP